MLHYFAVKDLPHIAAFKARLEQMQPITTLEQQDTFNATVREMQAAIEESFSEMAAICQSIHEAYATPRLVPDPTFHV